MSATADTVVLRRSRSTGPVAPPDRAESATQAAGRLTPRRAGVGLFSALMLGVLTIGLLGMLLVNTQLAQGAFAISELQRQQVALAEQEQQLADEVARASAPLELEMAARELGMVPQEMPTFLRLSDGAILGNAIPQPAPIEPTVPDVSTLVVDPVTGEVVRADTGEVVPEATVDEATGEIVLVEPDTGLSDDGLIVVEP